MWRTPEGDRALSDTEWAVFKTGLDWLWECIEQDIAAATDDTEAGVLVFDRLTPEQKLTLLRTPPTPSVTRRPRRRPTPPPARGPSWRC